jgi:hypothetical protein
MSQSSENALTKILINYTNKVFTLAVKVEVTPLRSIRQLIINRITFVGVRRDLSDKLYERYARVLLKALLMGFEKGNKYVFPNWHMDWQ